MCLPSDQDISLPICLYTLRGVNADDVIWCEEMAYMSVDLFFEVVLPLLEMQEAIIIGISTPVDSEFNFFGRLMDLTYPGTRRRVFRIFRVELICPRCRRKKVPSNCTHRLHLLPHWKSRKKFLTVKLIYEALGKHLTRERESMGASASNTALLFDEASIRALKHRPLYVPMPERRPDHVCIFVDPNAGGNNHMAIMSMIMIEGHIVVGIFILFFFSI